MRSFVTDLADEYYGDFESKDQVYSFVEELIRQADVDLRVDVFFEEYYDPEGERTFTDVEAEILNDLMSRAVDWSSRTDSNLYAIVSEVKQKIGEEKQ